MTVFEAPAKLNLSLLVSPPRRSDGYHPLASLVQTIEWCDLLEVRPGEGKDELVSDIDDNLVVKALSKAREFGTVPPLHIELHKNIPMEAGLGGGSSDAAAALLAASRFGALPASLSEIAGRIGADVALFLTGGTLMMTGVGDEIETVSAATGFAVTVVVPSFGLATKEVYRRWDEMDGPEATQIDDRSLPPSIRGRMPMRNDLLPAALSVEPLLGDFMSDVGAVWGVPVSLTGSGSACFGYFASVEEAADAASSVAHLSSRSVGMSLRDSGVRVLRDDPTPG